MNIWYQFIYLYGRDIICGVRLYRNESEFFMTHSSQCRILKTIEHELSF